MMIALSGTHLISSHLAPPASIFRNEHMAENHNDRTEKLFLDFFHLQEERLKLEAQLEEIMKEV